ncbi:hypothetical protein ASB62_09460 [Chlorobium limicola]|uniref:Uncharacterized protein n=1 Tax=Chlorobium limicola TaxID=1092 RepID=A0A124G6R2_CHLLI|nr:hypothetical protein ASB62_09460 [Chlorobium limicola]
MQVFMQTRPVAVMDKTENTRAHASNFGTDAYQSTRAGIPGVIRKRSAAFPFRHDICTLTDRSTYKNRMGAMLADDF